MASNFVEDLLGGDVAVDGVVVTPRRGVKNLVGATVSDNPATGQTDIAFTDAESLNGIAVPDTTPEDESVLVYDEDTQEWVHATIPSILVDGSPGDVYTQVAGTADFTAPIATVSDGTDVWVLNAGVAEPWETSYELGITRIDGTTRLITERVDIGNLDYEGVDLIWTGSKLWVLARANSGDDVVGSVTNTSSAAPAMAPPRMASARACSSTMPPRATLMTRSDGLAFSRRSRSMRPVVSFVLGRWIVRKSDSATSWSSAISSTPI